VFDVQERHTDVIKIARSRNASLWAACREAGWDDADLRQELLIRVWRRQSMASRYDPARSGVGNYLFLITRTILLNLLERKGNELPTSDSWGGDPFGQTSAGLVEGGALVPACTWHELLDDVERARLGWAGLAPAEERIAVSEAQLCMLAPVAKEGK
jgi:DNA-directed RNA polymerase specialized sigma24 family protein